MKQKKTIGSLSFVLLVLGGINAQETISATGGDASGSGGTINYTIGQTVYTTNSGTDGSVIQGVQQPYEITTTVGIDVSEINLELVAFPNPTTNSLTIRINKYDNEKLTYQLIDLEGKLLDNKQIIDNNTQVDLQKLPVSTYFINVLDNNSLIKTFKIIKK